MFNASKTYKPFIYPWAVEVAKQHEQCHWIESEVSLEDDINDWKRNKLTACEKEFITQVLRLFTQSDVSVGAYYYDHLIPIFGNNEIRGMLGSFAAREGIHQRAYALLNDSLGLPEGDYAKFLEYNEMKNKLEFMGLASADSHTNIGISLAKAVFNEGVSLFASFIMLLNFQRRGLMKGAGKIVEWSVRDETIHFTGISALFREFCKEYKKIVTNDFKATIYQLAKEVVSYEDKFIDLAYQNCHIEGLTAEEVKIYIRYLTDKRLIQLGLKGIFKVKTNPLPWVEIVLNAPDHTNFFEGKVSGYDVGGLTGDWGY